MATLRRRVRLTGRIWKCLIFWWWHKVSTNALGLLWLSRNRNSLTEERRQSLFQLLHKQQDIQYISQLRFHFGGFSTKTFEKLNANAAAVPWELFLILWVKARMLSGQKAVVVFGGWSYVSIFHIFISKQLQFKQVHWLRVRSPLPVYLSLLYDHFVGLLSHDATMEPDLSPVDDWNT